MQSINYMNEQDSIKQVIYCALIKYKLARVAKSLLKYPFAPKQYIDIVVNFAELYKDHAVLEQLWACGLAA